MKEKKMSEAAMQEKTAPTPSHGAVVPSPPPLDTPCSANRSANESKDAGFGLEPRAQSSVAMSEYEQHHLPLTLESNRFSAAATAAEFAAARARAAIRRPSSEPILSKSLLIGSDSMRAPRIESIAELPVRSL